MGAETGKPAVFLQSDRPLIVEAFRLASRIDGRPARAYRKNARIIAVEMTVPFSVETDRGVISGVPGDFLVTNHPDDDPGSDLWAISADRMKSTYEEAE